MRKFLLATMAILWLLTGLGGRLVAQENIAVWKFPMMGATSNPVSPDCVSDLIQSSDCELTVLTENWTIAAYDFNKSNTELCDVDADGTWGLRLVNSNGSFETASIVFKISTAAFRSINLSYDHRVLTAGGYATETWSYSTNGSTFTDMTPIEGGTTTYAGVEVDFSSISALNGLSSVWFKLTVSGATAANAATIIDNVVFSGTPMTCLPPVNMTAVADDAPTQAVISWEPAGTNEESYTLVYYTSQLVSQATLNQFLTNPTYESYVHANVTSPFTLNGLTANTTYYIYVRANCGGDDNSLWANTTVHTPTVCAISDLETTHIGGSTTSLSWTTDADNTMIRVFTAAKNNPWETTDGLFLEETVNGTTYDLTGLSFSTTYHVYAKSVCSANNMSESLHIYFTTYFADNISELTVADGTTTNGYVPVYGFYADAYLKAEFVIPAAQIEDMTDGEISQMKFYATQASVSWGSANFTVFLKEVESETLSAFSGTENATIVYTGSLSISDTVMSVTFNTPYTYNGGNLLVGVYNTEEGDYVTSTWKGVNTTGGTAFQGYSYSSLASISGTQRSFIPKTTFTYTPYVATCPKPSDLAANSVTATSAAITWVAGGEETQWVLKYGVAGFDIETEGTEVSIENTPSKDLTDLVANTPYEVYVKAICSDSDESKWRKISFRTACVAITEFPWAEDFETLATGDLNEPCWVNEHITGTGTSIFKVYASTVVGNATNKLQLPNMSSGTKTKLVLPEMTLPESHSYVFSIDVLRNASGSSYTSEGVRVYASTNGEIEGATELGFLYRNYTQTDGNVVIAQEGSGWYSYIFHIPFTGTCYIILVGENANGSVTYMDNLLVREASTAAEITAFSFAEEAEAADIDSEHATVNCLVSYSTESLNGLIPTIAVSENASISPESRVAQDFSSPVTYTVTAEDGTTTKEWTVNVNKVATASTAKDILSFTFNNQQGEAVIDAENHTVLAYAPWNYDFTTNIAPTITVSPLATIYPVSDSAINFASPVTYTVTAEDESTQDWTVTIVKDPNACVNPLATSISAAELYTTSAVLTWLKRYTETSYNVKVSTTAMTDMTAAADVYDGVVNDTALALSGLEESTTYYVYLQSACGIETWVSYSFYTGICIPGPTSVDGEGITNVTFGTGANIVSYNTHPTSSPYYGDYTAQVGAVQATSTATVSITYNTGIYTYGTIIWVNWNNDVQFTEDEIVYRGEPDNSQTLEATFYIPVTIPTGNYRMRIGGADYGFDSYLTSGNPDPCMSSAYTIYEDYTLQILPPPACMPVTNIAATNVTSSSADITWTLNDDTQNSWNVVVSTTALDDPETGTINEVTNALYNATELASNTPYFVYVRANCGTEGYSDWASATFRTECGAISELPYNEDFNIYVAQGYQDSNHEGVMPDCWSYIYNGTSADYAPHVSNSTAYAPMTGNDVNYLFVIASFASSDTYGNDNILIMPSLEGGYTNRHVSFVAKTSAMSNGVLHYGYMNGNEFVNLHDTTFTASTRTFSYIVPSSVPTNADFALKFTASSGTVYYGIDDVQVRETLSDNTILSYAASTAQGDAICNLDNEAHTISVELRAGATAPVVIGQTIVPHDPNATILQQVGSDFVVPRNYIQWYMTTADTTLTFKVIAENGAEESYTATITVESCAAPSALVSEQTSTTNVNCSWTAAEGTAAWNFYCSTTQLTPANLDALTASDYTTVTTATASATVTGETTYYWYVRTDCDGSYSAWQESLFSTWENCVAPTNLTTTVVNDNNIEVSWNVQDNLPLGPGIYTDDFERDAVNGGLLQYTNDATYPWVITTDAAHGGIRSAKSGNYNIANSTSSLIITADYTTDGTISFWARVSSEQTSISNDWDYGTFYIDGVQKGDKIINTTIFNPLTYDVTAGTHTFEWRYKKDGSLNSNDDCFYVDDITMPGLVPGGNSSVVVYRNDSELITLPATITSYTDEGLEAGNYCYKVKTICREGSESEFSAPACQDINSCLAVSNLSAADVTATSVTLSWTRGDAETAWILTVNDGSTVAINETSEGVTVNANVITYALAGLEPMTTYTVTIQSDCGGSVSQSVATVNFTTDRVPATLPYTCGFEDAVENNGWILENGTQTNQWYIGNAVNANHGGSNGLYISDDAGESYNYSTSDGSYYSGGGSSVYAYRTLNVTASSDYVVSFDWKANGESSYDYMRAFLVPSSVVLSAGNSNSISTSGAPANWIAIDGGAKLNLQTEWQTVNNTISIDAGMYNLVFYWKNDYMSGSQKPAAVDNIDIHVVSCPAVGELAAAPENITDNSAVITWTERGEAQAWEIIVSETAVTDFASATVESVIEETYSATGLNASTTYHVYVRANCADDDNSDWAHATFTTVASCPVPDGLVASAITGNSATITWNGYTASNWTLEHRQGTTGTWTVVEGLDAATYTIADLVGQTTYNVRVKAVCGDDEESEYSAILSFSTSCAAITEFPWNEGFENGIDCWTLVDGDGDTIQWQNTYLFGSNNGSYAMISESYNNDIGALTPNNWLISPAIDLTSQTGTIKLSYFVEGSDATFAREHYKVRLSTTTPDTASFTTLLVNDTSTAVWTEKTVNLSEYAGQVIYIAFVHCEITDMYVIVLDDVSVFVDNSVDAAIVELTAPTHGDYSTCALTDAEQVKVKILNNGGSAISNFDVSYTINDMTVTETVTASIEPAEIYEYTFEQTVDLSAIGTYTITVNVNLADDENADNDDGSMIITSGDALIRLHGQSSSYGGVEANRGTWSVTNTLTNQVVAASSAHWPWFVPVNEFVCVDQTQCYRVEVLDADGMVLPSSDTEHDPTFLEILYNGVQVAGSTEPNSFTGPSLVAERFTPNCQSSENDIITFSVPDMLSVDIDNESHTVTAEISYNSTEVLSAIVPTITVSDYAEITLAGDETYEEGAAQDFTNPVVYTVVAENGDVQQWTVTVTQATVASSEKDIVSFIFSGQVGESVIDPTEHTVTAYASWNISLEDPIAPTIEVSPMATISPESGSEQNFSEPVTYIVTAEDLTTQEWIVTITQDSSSFASLPYTCDFENDTENSNWVLENGTQTNNWYIGTAANNGGEYGLYISDDNGDSNHYNNVEETGSYVYAYRQIIVGEAGNYDISFDWLANGESSYDLLRAFAVPTTLGSTLVAGNANGMTSNNNTTPTGWIDIAPNPNNKLNLATDWQTSDTSVYLGAGTYNLVFFWKNDYSGGSQTPAAVDNISIERAEFFIDASVEGLGEIDPSGHISVADGDTLTFTMTPVEGFALARLMVDGVDLLSQVVNNTYTFENVSANHTIVAVFEPAIPIYASAGNGGYIDPSGEVYVGSGSSIEFNVYANAGYVISSVVVDGEEQITDDVIRTTYAYTFSNVTATHSINASFTQAADHRIKATAGVGGTVTPSGWVTVPYNGTKDFEFTPNEGYSIQSVIVDKDSINEVDVTRQLIDNTYTFNNVVIDHTITASFSVNSYNLTIHYRYADDSEAAEDYTATLNYGEEYSVESPAIDYYTADQLVVSGTMPAEDVEVTVIYNANRYNLTIHYRYADDSQAAPDYSEEVAFGTEYSVPSPFIDGYTANPLVVEGTMPAEDLEFTVRYIDASATHLLTIHYVYANDSVAAPDYTETLAEGATYSVPSPVFAGYTADRDTVAGTMLTDDVEVTVTYNANNYNLTVHYVYADDSEAAADYTESIAYNTEYSVASPVITGYTADLDTVAGIMPYEDVEETVHYNVNS
ncbi:MAG: fibronectin type III domain-containing protein, partial [Bacteroidales bacterium]|nr:fibronectin type III domain-containing protein [Bacteroidales bacterium]